MIVLKIWTLGMLVAMVNCLPRKFINKHDNSTWLYKDNYDANCDRDKAKMTTQKSLDDCVAAATTENHDIFSWNKVSHHCYTVNCDKYEGSSNPRTESGCLSSVDDCSGGPKPSPSPPSPPSPPHPKFDGVIRPQGDGSFAAYMIPPYISNHASTIEVLPDGTLAAAWFSGAHEEASGCAIVFARLHTNTTTWTSAATLSKRDGYSNQNPVLFYDNTTSVLHLFHSQAPANAGESESEIWHLRSSDMGSTWSQPESYFKDKGSFPRNRIIRRANNTILFPFYSTATGHPNYAVMGYSTTTSIGGPENWRLKEVQNSDDLVQPTVVREPKDVSKLIMFFRDRRAKNIYSAISSDEGNTWTTPKPTVLPNNNAGIEANSLISGNLVMVYNPQTSGRDPLAIAVSEDGGKTWPHMRYLQHGNSINLGGNEFSYPTVLQTKDGIIHVMFTYDRDTIKYMQVTEEWIKSSSLVE